MSERKVLVGLIGANIMWSLSPALHIDAFAAAGMDGYFRLMDIDVLKGRDLRQLLDAVKSAGFAGTNVTIPYKQEVLALLDEIDCEARQIGAVNTVTIAPDGRTKGYNTDCRGVRRNFEVGLGRARAEGESVVLVGAGGAGRAVAVALIELGVTALSIYDRETARAASLVKDLNKYSGAARARVSEYLQDDIEKAGGVVNATPIGMHGFPGNLVPVASLHAGQWAADVIYTPIETAFIKAARGKGAEVLTGGGMCVHQAAEAFRLFVGIEPDIKRMHATFARALAARDAAMAEPV